MNYLSFFLFENDIDFFKKLNSKKKQEIFIKNFDVKLRTNVYSFEDYDRDRYFRSFFAWLSRIEFLRTQQERIRQTRIIGRKNCFVQTAQLQQNLRGKNFIIKEKYGFREQCSIILMELEIKDHDTFVSIINFLIIFYLFFSLK